MPGLAELPVHLDWMAHRRGVRVGLDELGVRLGRAVEQGGPVGVMLHHAVMDAADLEAVGELLDLLRSLPDRVVLRPMSDCARDVVARDAADALAVARTDDQGDDQMTRTSGAAGTRPLAVLLALAAALLLALPSAAGAAPSGATVQVLVREARRRRRRRSRSCSGSAGTSSASCRWSAASRPACRRRGSRRCAARRPSRVSGRREGHHEERRRRRLRLRPGLLRPPPADHGVGGRDRPEHRAEQVPGRRPRGGPGRHRRHADGRPRPAAPGPRRPDERARRHRPLRPRLAHGRPDRR